MNKAIELDGKPVGRIQYDNDYLMYAGYDLAGSLLMKDKSYRTILQKLNGGQIKIKVFAESGEKYATDKTEEDTMYTGTIESNGQMKHYMNGKSASASELWAHLEQAYHEGFETGEPKEVMINIRRELDILKPVIEQITKTKEKKMSKKQTTVASVKTEAPKVAAKAVAAPKVEAAPYEPKKGIFHEKEYQVVGETEKFFICKEALTSRKTHRIRKDLMKLAA